LWSCLEKVSQPLPIYCDNQAALRLAKDLNYVSRTKHIDVRHHFVRERGLRGEIVYMNYPSENVCADSSTKVSRPERFNELVQNIGVRQM